MKPKIFKKKDERKRIAYRWEALMSKTFPEEIDRCISNSIIYDKKLVTLSYALKWKYDETDMMVVDMTTVDAIFEYCSDGVYTAALNFASYKYPGGGFISGSNAQEESLCHHSILYNVLQEFDDNFYGPNRQNTNNGAYADNMIYSKDVLFVSDDLSKKVCCDIITCAAPNLKAMTERGPERGVPIYLFMTSRIDHILFNAYENGATNLILGAFGCGVFGNDPNMVAKIFHSLLTTKYKGCFKTVVFAIPKGPNYEAFNRCFSSM